jgi:hypothetical protein
MSAYGYKKGDLGARDHGPPPDFKPGDRVVYARKHLEQMGEIDRKGFPARGSSGMAHQKGEVVAQHPRIAAWVSVRWNTDPVTEKACEANGWNGKDAIDFDDKPSEPHGPDDVIPFAPRYVSKSALAYDPRQRPNLRACE